MSPSLRQDCSARFVTHVQRAHLCGPRASISQPSPCRACNCPTLLSSRTLAAPAVFPPSIRLYSFFPWQSAAVPRTSPGRFFSFFHRPAHLRRSCFAIFLLFSSIFSTSFLNLLLSAPLTFLDLLVEQLCASHARLVCPRASLPVCATFCWFHSFDSSWAAHSSMPMAWHMLCTARLQSRWCHISTTQHDYLDSSRIFLSVPRTLLVTAPLLREGRTL